MPGKSFFHTDKRRPVDEIMELIKNKYVDDVSVDSLADTAIQAMLSKLDPHSVFIPAEELIQVNEDLAGKFYGIGIEFNILDDTLHVINVLKDGPSDKAGLLTGDKLLKVNDSSIAGVKIDAEKLRKLLRGDRDTKVTVTLMRNTTIKQITITRDAVPLRSVDASYMLTNGTGYIKLNKFSSQTYREFMEALEGLKKQGLKQLVLDLRGNGGGILEEAVEMADEFLDGDKLITYTEGKHAPRKEYRCRRVGQFEKGTLAILADEGTASASEVLIGALQDWDRAIIIGRRTFGKGLVGQQFDLSDNSALRLTIARYYTPLGRSIQRNYAKGGKAYFNEITNRYHDGETQYADSVKNDSSKIYHSKSGKKLFGGGGISPDYFIALDTSGYSLPLVLLAEKNTLQDFAYRYYLQNQNRVKEFKDCNSFIQNFSLAPFEWDNFTTTAAKDSIILTKLTAIEKDHIQLNIKAAIARILWHTEGFVEVLNTNDNGVRKSLQILGNN